MASTQSYKQGNSVVITLVLVALLIIAYFFLSSKKKEMTFNENTKTQEETQQENTAVSTQTIIEKTNQNQTVVDDTDLSALEAEASQPNQDIDDLQFEDLGL